MKIFRNFNLLFKKSVLNKNGQLALPAVMCVPIVLLLIYLLKETTDLSAEKIHHQFALDTATYTELSFPVGTLNGFAYMNGAMPFELYREVFTDPKDDYNKVPGNEARNNGGKVRMMYDFLAESGAFVAPDDPTTFDDSRPRDADKRWTFHYRKGTRDEWDSPNPKQLKKEPKPLMINNDNLSNEEWKLESIYASNALLFYMGLAGIMEEIVTGHQKILDDVRDKSEFFRRTYYFNTLKGRESDAGREGARQVKKFNKITTLPMYIEGQLSYYYVTRSDILANGIVTPSYGNARRDIKLDEFSKKFDMIKTKDKIFQFVYLDRSTQKKLRDLQKGAPVVQSFEAPKNYFNVDMKKYKPRVKVRVQVMCPDSKNNCVWPDPTPNYQVRLLP